MNDERAPEAKTIEPDPRIEARARARILALADDPAAVKARLVELDAEWDIERVLEANALIMSVIGTGAVVARRRRLARSLPAAVALAVLGLAADTARPPVAMLRRLGFRTAEEIARERAALVALHGGLSFASPPRPDLSAAVLSRLRRLVRR